MDEERRERREKARSLFESGYNCAQATLLAFEDVLPYSREELAKMSCSFGGGMARLREVCGACSGMFLAAGLLYGYEDTGLGGKKGEHYRLIQELGLEFERRNGTMICRELLGFAGRHDSPEPTERTPDFYQHRKCGEFIMSAADILEAYMENHPPKRESGR